jgi:ribosome-binding protein aMBF1 (putative translation factor)
MEPHKNQDAKLESVPAKPEEGKLGGEKQTTTPAKSAKRVKNNVRKARMDRMMSKAELARRAGLSTLTVDRVERGMSCRMDTKRKILEALGLKPQDRVMVFGEAEED